MKGIRNSTLAYFDGINFAPRIACPIMLYIGLQDDVCPLEVGYAVWQTIGSKDKSIYPYDGHGHDFYKNGLYQEWWLARQFGFSGVIVPAHWQSGNLLTKLIF